MSGDDLQECAQEGNIGEVQRLLRQGVDLNSKNRVTCLYEFVCVCLYEFCVFVFCVCVCFCL